MLICGAGAVLVVAKLIGFFAIDQTFDIRAIDLSYGLIAGVAVTVSNILLLECLTHLDVSLGSTIYRLNTVAVLILSYWFLSEPFGLVKALGIVSGIGATLLLLETESGRTVSPALFGRFFLLAIVTSLSRAVYGVISKAGLTEGADPHMLILLAGLSWMAGGLTYAQWREGSIAVSRTMIGYALVAGLLVVVVVHALIAAVQLAEASVVIPIANLSFCVALLIALVASMERLTLRKTSAVGLASLAIVLLAQA